MTLEELRTKTDDELNDLAAIKLLWKGIVNVRSDDFTPVTDMNNAYDLMKILIPEWTVSIGHNLSGWEVGLWTGVKDGEKYVSATDQSLSKSITMATILAKSE